MSRHLSLVPSPLGPDRAGAGHTGHIGPTGADPGLADLDEVGCAVRVVHGGAAAARSARLEVCGELDTLGAPVLRAVWDATDLQEATRVVVDLSETEFCNAAGVRVLAHIVDTCAQRGVHLQMLARGFLARLLHMMGVASHEVIPAVSRSAAVAD